MYTFSSVWYCESVYASTTPLIVGVLIERTYIAYSLMQLHFVLIMYVYVDTHLGALGLSPGVQTRHTWHVHRLGDTASSDGSALMGHFIGDCSIDNPCRMNETRPEGFPPVLQEIGAFNVDNSAARCYYRRSRPDVVLRILFRDSSSRTILLLSARKRRRKYFHA